MYHDRIEIPQKARMFRSARSQSWRIANLPHIAEAWGGDVVSDVLDAVQDRSDRLAAFGASGRVSLLGMYEALSAEPVVIGASSIHPVVVSSELGHVTAPVGLLPSDDAAADQYRDDMRVAATAFRFLKERQTQFLLQPIFDVRTRETFYEEALIRFPGPAGASPLRYIEAIERLGLAQAFDGQVVNLAIAQMKDAPHAVLGVNISAQSVLPGGWRDNLARELSFLPDLASRLVIEITESASLPSVVGAQTITERFRSIGCKIAIDDFGEKFNSIKRVSDLKPDIIKIGGNFINGAINCDKGRNIFAGIMMMVTASAKTVVVEGVETAQQSSLADSLGGNFQQGFFHKNEGRTGMGK